MLGIVIALSGVPLYFVWVDTPWVRASGLPAFAGAGLGFLLAAFAAWRDRRRWVRFSAAGCGALLALFVFAFFWIADLPAPAVESAVAAAPEFTLPDQDERPTVLRDAYAAGPVLLVFYRGHW